MSHTCGREHCHATATWWTVAESTGEELWWCDRHVRDALHALGDSVQTHREACPCGRPWDQDHSDCDWMWSEPSDRIRLTAAEMGEQDWLAWERDKAREWAEEDRLEQLRNADTEPAPSNEAAE